MKISILPILLCFISLEALSQVKGVVLEENSGAAIPYTNIWVEHQNTGTTSGEDGKFYLPKLDEAKTLVFTAIGYETKKIKLEALSDTVYLKADPIGLSEVVISPRKSTRKQSVGKFDRRKINFYFGTGTSPWIVARFFPYKKEYEKTAFLQQVRVLTASDVKDAKFHIRLYTIGANGEPADYLHDQNIVAVARKGKRVTEIDISELNIRFPEKGFFVAIEWLIIDSNRHEYKTRMSQASLIGGSDVNGTRTSYQPAIGTVPGETDENSWILSKGKWGKVFRNRFASNERYRDKYNLLAIELILSN